MNDVTNRILEIGDLVVATDSHYKDLIQGQVVDFTPKKVKIKISNAAGYYLKPGDIVYKFPAQISRIDYCKPGDLAEILKEK